MSTAQGSPAYGAYELRLVSIIYYCKQWKQTRHTENNIMGQRLYEVCKA
jgi:hypothetical protein